MTSSIYHFFEDLYQRRSELANKELDQFSYKDELLSLSKSSWKFPDLAIRVNPKRKNLNCNPYRGGELIELKDSKSGYNVAQFNSTMPSGTKLIKDIDSTIRDKMTEAGDKVFSLKEREVYYLIRGKRKDSIKICLVHGSFFETVPSITILKSAFGQAINKAISDSLSSSNVDFKEVKKDILKLNWKQSHFSSTRRTKKSSIHVRFRVMSQVAAEANLLSSSQYPCIKDNTLNLVLPLTKNPNADDIKKAASNQKKLLSGAFENKKLPDEIEHFVMHHNIQQDWQYIVFQCPL